LTIFTTSIAAAIRAQTYGAPANDRAPSSRSSRTNVLHAAVRWLSRQELRAGPNVLNTTNNKFGEAPMDWNRVEGNWKQTKGKIKEKWGQLTDDDLTQIAGKRDQLEGKIQERYGVAKDKARTDIDNWLKTMN
jgi:uncharacterized protein YjbJ (UPF0337 family)